MALRRSLLALTALLVPLAVGGCQAAPEEETDEGAGAFYGVPSPKEGDGREVVLSNVPARSRNAEKRRQGRADDVIATWHVHHIVTEEGFRGVVMYGADKEGMVRLSFVIDDNATSLVIVEPDEDDTSEAALSEVTGKTHAPISPAMLQWFADEFGRLGRDAAAAEAARGSGDLQTKIVFNLTWKCAARLTTMVLSMASNIVLSPVGGVVVAAAEAAAWGDFGGAAVIGGIGGANAATTAMKASGVAAVRKAGSALKGLGVVGVVGLIGVALVLDPKEALQGLVPNQCK